MIRRGSARGGLLALLALLLAVPSASAAPPEGPRLAYGQWGAGSLSVSLLSVDSFSANPLRLFHGHRRRRPLPLPFDAVSWFPDGSALAFTGITGSLSGKGLGSKIFLVSPDGGRPSPVAGTGGALSPVVSPDGRAIAFARLRTRTRVTRRPGGYSERTERAVSTWIVDLGGGPPRRLTPSRYGLEAIPSAFTPDGSTLAVTRSDGGGDADVMALDVEGGGWTQMLASASAARFSPDGSKVAYLRHGPQIVEPDNGGFSSSRATDLYVSQLDGGGSVRLTRTPKRIEISPAWDPSGHRVAFVQFGTIRSLLRTLGAGNSIVQINADGTCRTKMVSWPDAIVFGPVWQPGAGREAGRIPC